MDDEFTATVITARNLTDTVLRDLVFSFSHFLVCVSLIMNADYIMCGKISLTVTTYRFTKISTTTRDPITQMRPHRR